jgi:hypothetical protein
MYFTHLYWRITHTTGSAADRRPFCWLPGYLIMDFAANLIRLFALQCVIVVFLVGAVDSECHMR